MTAPARWILPRASDPTQVHEIGKALNLSRVVAELLVQRGYEDVEAARNFISPRLSTLSDPFLLPDMEPAVHRILKAVDDGEKIVLYGDYDVDGLTSLTVMRRILDHYNARVDCFMPLRKEEGYGLSAKGVSRCVEEFKPRLLIAIDCGTSSVSEISELNKRGIDVIVLDHHECPAALPKCVALVNPKRGSAFGYLCSVGIAFKTAHALMKQRPNPSVELKEFLDLVALGSIADLVPLIGENRILVHKGLLQMENTKWQGLKTLAQSSGVKPPWVSSDIGFKLGPRLNAAGRLGEARRALDLLMCADAKEADAFARELEMENNHRKTIGDHVHQLAEAQVAARFNPDRDRVILVGDEGWHEGVIGIVASRLMYKYHRPCIVVGFDEEGNGKGSGRSVEGFSLVAALQACREELVKFGGHEMAAGLSVKRSQFESFGRKLAEYAAAHLKVSDLVERHAPNIEVRLHELTVQLLEEVGRLGPFGTDNAQPSFLLRQVSPVGQPRVMKEKHLSIELRQDKQTNRAIWFNGAADPLPPAPWDVMFELTRNEYQGRVQPQIQIKALRSSVE